MQQAESRTNPRCASFIAVLNYLAPATVWFYRIHLVYILFVTLVGGAVLYAIQETTSPRHYIDCAFILAASVTGGGLQTFDVAPLARGSQAIIFTATLIGGVVFLSAVPATYRRIVIWRAARTALACETGTEPRLASYLATHIEYRALAWVRTLVLAYWAVSQVAVWLALGTYLAVFPGSAALEARSGVNVWWFSAFTTVTAFANVGLIPLPDGLSQFSGDYAVLLLLALMIVLGYTMYPVALRALAWAVHVCLGRADPALQYVLDRPRRVHTHLFPPIQTAAVFGANAFLVALQWVIYASTCAGLPVFANYSGDVRSLVAFFQAVSARAAGFTIVDLSTISAAAQLSSFIAMFVPAHPFAVSLSGLHNHSGPMPSADTSAVAAAPACGAPVSLDAALPPRPAAHFPAVLDAFRFSPSRRVNLERRLRRSSALPTDVPTFSDRERARARSHTPVTAIFPTAVAARSRELSVNRESSGRSHDSLSNRRTLPALPLNWTPDATMGSVANFMGGANIAAILDRAAGRSGENAQVTASVALSKLGESLSELVENDVLWLAVALLVLCLIENSRLFADPDPAHHFSLFACAFELMSAYATCGISMGYPGDNNSLSKEFTTLGKLVVIAVMIAGRLRGFPHAVSDRAVLPAIEAFMPTPRATESPRVEGGVNVPAVASGASDTPSGGAGAAASVTPTRPPLAPQLRAATAEASPSGAARDPAAAAAAAAALSGVDPAAGADSVGIEMADLA